jgi:L-serine deaminase
MLSQEQIAEQITYRERRKVIDTFGEEHGPFKIHDVACELLKENEELREELREAWKKVEFYLRRTSESNQG